MSFSINRKAISICTKYEFSIYEHVLSFNDLDNYILEIIYEEKKLNYLFQLNATFDKKDRIKQLQRFIGNPFRNREEDVNDAEIRSDISDNITNQSYFTFFAEALLARLNIDFIDNNLVSGVLKIGDNVSITGQGADVCMYSENILVLGEAKFYGDLYGGTYKIIKDKSFKSKLGDYIARLQSADSIILKNINCEITTKTEDEIKLLPLVLSGFILHTADNPMSKYDKSYKLIDKIAINDFPSHYKVHLFHLPIESKAELIFKAQRKALDLIIELKSKWSTRRIAKN